MRIPYKALIVAALGTVLTACNLVIVQDSPGPRANYFDGDFEYAVSNGSIITHIAGNPFKEPKSQLDSAVRRIMTRSITIPAKFVEKDDGNTVPASKVVVSFNTPPGISNENLCEQGIKTPTQHRKGAVKVNLAFCDGDRLQSGVKAWLSGITSFRDEGFEDLIKQATLNMIPAQDNQDVGEHIP